MKINILKFIVLTASVTLTHLLSAQNLDPTVVVNRAYEGRLLEVHKPAMEMTVPDSVRQFDLDFDYAVFSNPYKGSYEFKPYQLLMKPYAAGKDPSVLYLRAGAGYTLHPELDFVWTPVSKGRFTMSVYAGHGSYIGGYRSFKPDFTQGGTAVLQRWETSGRSSSIWKGYSMKSNAGIDGRYDWTGGMLMFDLGYMGIAAKDTSGRRGYNAFDMNLRVASKPRGDNYFLYDAVLDYRFGAGLDVNEHLFSMKAQLGPVLSVAHHILFDIGFDVAAYSGALESSVTELYIVPHYVFSKDRWHVDLGVRLAKLIRPEESDMFGVRDQIIYPDVKVSYSALAGALGIYAKADGGNSLNTFSSLLERNHFTDLRYARGGHLLDATVKQIDVAAGLYGRVSRSFSYDVHAGYAVLRNGLLDGVFLSETLSGSMSYLPGIGYASYGKFYAEAEWDWHTERIRFDGNLDYTLASDLKDGAYGLFKPAALTGRASFAYNWNRRIFAGVDCLFSTSREGTLRHEAYEGTEPYVPVMAVIPAYADLGISAEVAVSRRFSVWLRGGNLLNMTVQHTPLYAEKGVNFTAGICVKL